MTRSFRMLFVAAACALVLGCATSGLAQKVGGYKTTSADGADVKAAAEFAVAAQNKVDDFNRTLNEIRSAEKQVVAGINYRMCLKVTLGGDEGEIHFVKVVVYMDLKKVYKLTSWTEEACSSDEKPNN
jgi:hypothetical protein